MEETKRQIFDAAVVGQETAIASDEEVEEVSRTLLERNKAAYQELAK